MIVTTAQARSILAGRTTQLRIPVQNPREVTRKNGTTYTTVPFRPRTGQRLPVAVRRTIDGTMLAEQVCHIIIDRWRHEPLGDMAFTDALAEGYKTTVECKAAWVRQHDPAWLTATEPVFCPDCTLDWDWPGDTMPDCPTCGGDGEIRIIPNRTDTEHAARYDQRWANTPCWIITFHRDPVEQPRYPAAIGRGDDRGYTTSPAEAVDAAAVGDDWLKLFAAESAQDNARRRGEIEDDLLAERRHLGRRLMNAKALARDRGVDVNSDLRVIERRIAAIENKIRRQHPAA